MQKTKEIQEEIAEFDVSMLVNIVIGLAVAGLVSVFALQLMGDTQKDLGTDACKVRTDTLTSYNHSSKTCYNASETASPQTDEYNASQNAITGVAKVPAKLPLIATALVFLLIIAVIIRIAVIGRQV